MADPKGFLTYDRADLTYRPVAERLDDYAEVSIPLPEGVTHQQAARCMDCGVPFCHAIGCPLHNNVPEFNDLVYQRRWREALNVLHSTNNFPEFTGRICPAPCEASCTLNIDQNPVLIEHIELQIAERGWKEGWIQPIIAEKKTGKKVAIVGSGPAGLATAQQLTRLGHEVTVFEKDDRIGGLLRYGIPDFKLDKGVIDRRLEQMMAEGVRFEAGVKIGEDISSRYLQRTFDATCLAMGAGTPRDLPITGRELGNVHFAMNFLGQQNSVVAGDVIPANDRLSAAGKVVVVIGGGDTGSDCVGTSNRHGAKAIHQFEIMPQPPEGQNPETPWPVWPQILRTSSSHKEGCNRRWSVVTNELIGKKGVVTQLKGCTVEWYKKRDGRHAFKEVKGSEFTMDVDLVLLAMGFVHVEQPGIVTDLGVELDPRGNVRKHDMHMTNVPGIFACGDTVSGASLVVRAINDGRICATGIDQWLKKQSVSGTP